MLAIIKLFCEYILQGDENRGVARRLVFGVNKSVASLRADYDGPDVTNIDVCGDMLWTKVKSAGATSLSISTWRDGIKYLRHYTLSGRESSESTDDAIQDGLWSDAKMRMKR